MLFNRSVKDDLRDGRNSITLKLIAVAVLVLIFLIPVSMVKGLIQERQFRQQDVMREVDNTWGQAQTIVGPVLVVPYGVLQYGAQYKDQVSSVPTGFAYFLPETLAVDGKVEVEVRSRGIYDVPVYGAKLTVSGVFPAPDVKSLNLASSQMRWQQASLVLGLPDLRGVREQIKLGWNGEEYLFTSGVTVPVVPGGVSVSVPLALNSTGDSVVPDKQYKFSLTLDTRGSDVLSFVPVGKETSVKLTSNWPEPSFTGAFLPTERSVGASGFTAAWRVLDLNRNFPQQWTSQDQMQLGFASYDNWKSPRSVSYFGIGRFDEPAPYQSSIDQNGAFGVRLLLPSDIYEKSMRSAKYGIAVIALVFVIIFFVELSAKRRVHAVQYVLIGLALVIYYTLLLSLAEHLRFGWAYLIASAAVIGMNTLFAKSVMQSGSRALLAGSILTVFYGFVYILLQLEDYAFLFGSIALFLILAVIMFLSRKIEWYSGGQKIG